MPGGLLPRSSSTASSIPGPGDLARAAVVVNEPARRGRYTGTDLLPFFAERAPLDVFGMGVRDLAARLGAGTAAIRGIEDLPQGRMHDALSRRRVAAGGR